MVMSFEEAKRMENIKHEHRKDIMEMEELFARAEHDRLFTREQQRHDNEMREARFYAEEFGGLEEERAAAMREAREGAE